MAKKYKSAKLAKQPITVAQKPVSAFGKLANRLADSKKKKIQKLTDTQKRLSQSKKNNKMIKVSKKAKKFALLDEEDSSGHGAQGLGLTHRGINVKDLKEFDNVNFNESDLENDEDFDNLQEKMNFAGFEATDNLLEEKNLAQQNNRPKTQNQIYKQIIEKSKAYKMVRQQQYQDNFNKANELDAGFEELVTQLKFRNKDQQLLQKIQHRDLEYDKLMNQLKEDERVVSNKVVEKSEKVTEKIRKKKNEQLNKLMRDSDGEEGDIRGWVEEEALSQQEEQENQNEYEEEEDDQQGGEEGGEESYDELDEVDLSSQQEEEDGEGESFQGEEQEEEGDDEQIDGQEGDYSEQDENDQDDQDEDQDDEQQQSQSLIPPTKKNHKHQNNQPQAQSNKAPQNPKLQSKQNPQKKVKRNVLQ